MERPLSAFYSTCVKQRQIVMVKFLSHYDSQEKEEEKRCVSIGLSIRNNGTQQKGEQIGVAKRSTYPSIP